MCSVCVCVHARSSTGNTKKNLGCTYTLGLFPFLSVSFLIWKN